MAISTRMTQEQRRKQIVRETMRIINEEGYPAFTTRRLAEKVGITEPALYRHFTNKDDIIINVVLLMDELWNGLENELRDIQNDQDKLCHFIMSHFQYIADNPDILAVIFADEFTRLNKSVSDVFTKTAGKRYAYLKKLMHKLAEQGLIQEQNPDIIALVIVGTIRITAQSWRNSDYSFSLTEFGEEVCCNLTGMIFNKQMEEK